MRVGNAAGQISSYNIVKLSRSGDRMAVPVRPNLTIYAQYRHIFGRPAGEGQHAVPLSRMRILNSLIHSLRELNKEPSPGPANTDRNGPASDALIQNYAAELHRAVANVPESFGTLPGSAGAGIVFNLSA